MADEDKESSDSGSITKRLIHRNRSIPHSESEYSQTNGDENGGRLRGLGGGVMPLVAVSSGLSMLSISGEVVGGGGPGGAGGVGSGGVVIDSIAPVMGGGGIGGRGSGNGDSTMGKKRRGRPRMYDADGKWIAALSHDNSSTPKRGRGKHSASAGNLQNLASSSGWSYANTAGRDFSPVVVTVHTGGDVAENIIDVARKCRRGVCVLSANGTVSNATLYRPAVSATRIIYEGCHEILSLGGSYIYSDTGGVSTYSGGLSVSLASSSGRVIGGSVADSLIAASPVQMVLGIFLPYCHEKQRNEPRSAPAALCPRATAIAATPISQVYPVTSIPFLHDFIQSRGGGDSGQSNEGHPNSASTDNTAYRNGSGPSPCINFLLPTDEQ